MRLAAIEQEHKNRIARSHESRRNNRWNDSSAGSPTETLLQLLLPLNVKVDTSSSWMSPVLPQSTSRFHLLTDIEFFDFYQFSTLHLQPEYSFYLG